MDENVDNLIQAVWAFREALDRAGAHCATCGAAQTLAVERARSLIVLRAQQIADEAQVAA